MTSAVIDGDLRRSQILQQCNSAAYKSKSGTGIGIRRERLIYRCHIVQIVMWTLNYMIISCNISLKKFF